MNIKIQGGGSGTYANTGSCTGVTTYLQHEDLERMKNGQEVQPFFNNSRDYISAQEVTFKIDNNKAKLSRNDAKFYVITVSPSSRELEKMGKTEKEQAEAMRKYVRDDVMQHFYFPYRFLFVTHPAKFPVCFFLIFLKNFDFVT